jgi:hypothetical protein
MVNISEMYDSGHGFAIRDIEPEFDDNGELLGYGCAIQSSVDTQELTLNYAVELTERIEAMGVQAGMAYSQGDDTEVSRCEVDIDYLSGELDDTLATIKALSYWQTTSEGFDNVSELRDSPGDRWGHILDSYLEEQELSEFSCRPRDSDKIQDTYRLREFWQNMRATRHQRLMLHAMACKRRSRFTTLNKLKQGVRSRYIASVKLVVSRGATEWGELLYLTKVQYQDIMGV